LAALFLTRLGVPPLVAFVTIGSGRCGGIW
jgi:hypothetical protein